MSPQLKPPLARHLFPVLSAAPLCAIARDFVLSDFLQRSVYFQIDMAQNYASRPITCIASGASGSYSHMCGLCKHLSIFANGTKDDFESRLIMSF